MLSSLLASNGLYLFMFVLCCIGGYQAAKARQARKEQGEKQGGFLSRLLGRKGPEQVIVKEVRVYDADEKEEEPD